MKYIKSLREHFDNPDFPVVKLFEIRTLLKQKGIHDAYLKRLINYMLKKGELKRITKGVYTFHDDITVVGFAFQPFYYGLENALTIRKLWEQETNPIVITAKQARNGMRKFESANYLVQRLDRKLFFGCELVRYYNFWIPVSDYEKTILDFVYFKHHIRADVLKELKRRIDKKRLRTYLKRYPKWVKVSVLRLVK
ncbi:MAG: type IV toxin-antitoxin system AbiEi family antitoxin domain-containing protein [Candidatus Marsarchaeota archaeon]|nr:type IV toxin-antitoxin system AbiEi family antitoxin domain-containing protein [Candidatus Marsarchaeota archaeon]